MYDPVWTGAVLDGRDFAVAVAGFLLLAIWKWPPLAVVLSVAVAGALLTMPA